MNSLRVTNLLLLGILMFLAALAFNVKDGPVREVYAQSGSNTATATSIYGCYRASPGSDCQLKAVAVDLGGRLVISSVK